MRMQLIKKTGLLTIVAIMVFCLSLIQGYAQDKNVASLAKDGKSKQTPVVNNKKGEDNDTLKKKKMSESEVNILFSYYTQDGNNSAVTGGKGTEALQDYAPAIIATLAINDQHKVTANGGIDYYTSASSDMIDQNFSSASREDVRIHGAIGYAYSSPLKTWTYGMKIGGSTEYDYVSYHFGASVGWLSKNQNTGIDLSGQAFLDSWLLIYPRELRRKGPLVDTDKRRSYTLSLTFSHLINKRMQFALTGDFVHQQGLLSTPFHRVYFKEQSAPKVERLPGKRLKTPLALRFNYYISDRLISRLYYRYYRDDWGLTAHSFEIEMPLKITRFMSVYPFYRFHSQTAADYFKPYKEHLLSDMYYTSDYDLSALNSHKAGLGFRFYPVKGLLNVKFRPLLKDKNLISWKGIDLRYAHYFRTNGLQADIISVGMNFAF